VNSRPYRERATRRSEPDGRPAEPSLPADADPRLLDPSVRAELRSLTADTAETVARHLVAAGIIVDDDPQQALRHARFARSIAARVGSVREAVGVAAYHAQEWAEALAELRAARRITGDARWLAVTADCERALGRPDRALKALLDPELSTLDPETQIEVLIVVAGARRDLGQPDAALQVLDRAKPDRSRPRAGSSRLWYAYADVLTDLGRVEEAKAWFTAVAGLDEDETDAAERAGLTQPTD
jgi:tetratricopeptide (TPR) repeat protein